MSDPLMISKQVLAEMPAATFEGNIMVIDNPEEVPKAIKLLRSSDILGFDTETKPNFKKGQNHRVSLLQLSTRSTCYLFRLNKTGLTDDIRQLLEDESKLKVGLSIHDDFHNLRRLCEDLQPKGFIELQQYVKKVNIGEGALSKIYGIIFHHRISKGQRLTNWEAEKLTPAQMHYAALDAMACINIYEAIENGKFK